MRVVIEIPQKVEAKLKGALPLLGPSLPEISNLFLFIMREILLTLSAVAELSMVLSLPANCVQSVRSHDTIVIE